MFAPSVPLLFLAASAALVYLWIATRSRRRLKDPQLLPSLLHPGELRTLSRYLARDYDPLDSDSDFWAASGRLRGLLRKRRNAVVLVHACQALCSQKEVHPRVLQYMTRRSLLITFLVGCSIAEACVRLIVRDLPHLSARTATQLYWDMELRARTLCDEFRPSNPKLADELTLAL